MSLPARPCPRPFRSRSGSPFRETPVGQQPPKRLEAETALADVFVTVDAAAERLLRVVAVKDLQSIEADEPIERLERVGDSRKGRDVISRSEQMTGIQADADPRRAIEMRHDRREMFKAMADGSALSRRVLEKHHHLLARAQLEGARDCLRDEPERILFAAGRARPGWITTPRRPSDSARSSSSMNAAIDCSRKLRLRRGEIDQVAGVRHDRRELGLRRRAGETCDFVRRERLGRATGSHSCRRSAAPRIRGRQRDRRLSTPRRRPTCVRLFAWWLGVAVLRLSQLDGGGSAWNSALHFHNADIVPMPDK